MGVGHETGDAIELSAEELRRSMRRRFRWLTGGLVALTLVLNVAPVAANHLTVRSSDIVDGAVRTNDLHNNAVKSAKINDGAVQTPDIRNGAVGTKKLKTGAVTRNNLASPIRTKTSSWRYALESDDLAVDGTNLTHRIIQAPAITNDVIARGGVEVYFRYGSRIWSLPYTSHAGAKPNTLDFFLTPGEIHITRFAHDNSSIGMSSSLQFRYVIVPSQQDVGPVLGVTEADADNAAASEGSSTE